VLTIFAPGFYLLHSNKNVQVSDTTEADSSKTAEPHQF
jgi:hypothetical protein